MSTDAARARAHYKWAGRYKDRGEHKKSEAHLDRGKHYERRGLAFGAGSPAFGVERDHEKSPTTLTVGYNAPLNARYEDDHTSDKGDADSVWLWRPPDQQQLIASCW